MERNKPYIDGPLGEDEPIKWQYEIVYSDYFGKINRSDLNLDSNLNIARFYPHSRENFLNQMGQNGWELVSITTGNQEQKTFYFKRQLNK